MFLAGSLAIAPDAELMSGTADDIGLAVTVEIVGIHVGAVGTEIGGMEPPRLVANLSRLFPPAAGDNHIELAVAVDIADAQTVRESLSAGDFLARAGNGLAVLHVL